MAYITDWFIFHNAIGIQLQSSILPNMQVSFVNLKIRFLKKSLIAELTKEFVVPRARRRMSSKYVKL